MPDIGIAVNVGAHGGVPLAALRPLLDDRARIGFSHAELFAGDLGVIVGGALQPTRLAALRAALAGCPLRLTLHGTAVASSRVANPLDVTTPNQRRSLAADLDLAVAIGATVLVQHSGLLRDPYGDDDALAAGLAAERDAVRALGDEAGRHGVRIAVENRDPVGAYLDRRAYGLSLERLAEQIAAVDHPQVGVCLDTGHAFLAARYLGTDYLTGVRAVAPLVNHLHLSDNLGRVQLDRAADPRESLALGDGDLHLPPGWGAVPFADLLAVPFRQRPIALLELRATFLPHAAEALATTRDLLTAAATAAG